MEYTEVRIKVANEQPLRESLMALLLSIGYDSFMEAETSISAYIETGQFDQAGLNEVLNTFKGKAELEEIGKLPDQNWNAIWESNYEPVLIAGKCMVRAPFHPKPDGVEFDIVIQPKMSFGTAHHSTTRLMIELMLKHDFSGKRALDIGSGTGVLAILASLMGAVHATAIDNDEWAYNNAVENCEMNGIKNIDVIFGDATAIPGGVYDVILANINRNILLNDICRYNAHMKAGTLVFLSGFYEADFGAIIAETDKFSLQLVEHAIREEWVAAVFRKG